MATLINPARSQGADVNAVVAPRVFGALVYLLLDVSHIQPTPGLPIMCGHFLCTRLKQWLCHQHVAVVVWWRG